jgi:HEAT repeat protein
MDFGTKYLNRGYTNMQAQERSGNAKVKELLQKIQSDSAETRTQAWLAAGEAGPAALKPLAKIAAEGSLEVGRAANRAMWKIVHTVGAPGAKGKEPACKQLAALLADDQPVSVRREVLWMLSEIADGGSVPAVAALLNNAELREDARCALQRIPGPEAVAALKASFAAAPEEFKYALADSLRRRGEEVEGYPTKKRVPVKPTRVKPVGRAAG